MWTLGGAVAFTVMAVVSSAVTPPASIATISEAVSSNQASISQLSQAVENMVKADADIKNQLVEATNAIIESQNALQKVFAKRKQSKDGSTDGMGDGVMKQFANQLIETLRGYSPRGLGNSSRGMTAKDPVLGEILAELKDLNSHFQAHLTSLSCPPPFVMLGSECFNVLLEDMSWPDARNSCLRIGADLAQPSNITELKIYVGHRYPRKSMRNFWIGGVYREKVWQWLSGDPLEEGYWHTNEPSGNGDCLAMFDGWENPFTDFPCERERRAICKRTLVG